MTPSFSSSLHLWVKDVMFPQSICCTSSYVAQRMEEQQCLFSWLFAFHLAPALLCSKSSLLSWTASSFTIVGLSPPFSTGLLFSLSFLWQWCFWAKQGGDSIDFAMGGKNSCFVSSGVWETGRKKGREAAAFGIHVIPLLLPVLKQ